MTILLRASFFLGRSPVGMARGQESSCPAWHHAQRGHYLRLTLTARARASRLPLVRLIDTRRHAILLPAAALVAVIVLVGGQTILQHVLGGTSTLGVVIEFVGGLVFLVMLLHGVRR